MIKHRDTRMQSKSRIKLGDTRMHYIFRFFLSGKLMVDVKYHLRNVEVQYMDSCCSHWFVELLCIVISC